LLSASVLAETITLTDGTRLSGKVLSMNDGVYTIDSSSLGRVRVRSSQVASISAGNGAANTSTETNKFSNAQEQTFKSLQSAISNDQGAMAEILKLQNDPLMQSILADKEIMNAVSRGDYGSLAENPKIQRLMDHQTVKSISRKYTVN
jgi:hypothetical protein